MAVRGGCMLVVKCLLFFFNFVLWHILPTDVNPVAVLSACDVTIPKGNISLDIFKGLDVANLSQCAGGTILGFAIWVRFNEDFFKQIPEEAGIGVYDYTYIVMAAGGAIMVVGFFGCCGAIRESVCQLSTYFVIVFIIFCAEIAAGVWMYIEKDKIGQSAGEYFDKLVQEKYSGDVSIQILVDYTQKRLGCCGSSGPDDWTSSNQPIPDSCGRNCTEGCYDTVDNETFDEGCKSKIIAILQQNLYIVGVTCATVALVEVLAMILTIFLCKRIRREMDEDDEKPYNA